jgi:3-hydroxyacyl-[acyl-carrier-protein] dehydratase
MTEKHPSHLVLGIEDIKHLLPHRSPFLFVERLTDIVVNESATGHKAIGYNEPYFQGHFPDHPVMPGVLHSLGKVSSNRVTYFMTIEKARFRRPVRPGDMLRMEVKALRRRGPVWRFAGEAFVGDMLCAEAEFSAMIRDSTDDGENGDSSNRNR